MRRRLTLLFSASCALAMTTPPGYGGFHLAGEPLRFDARLQPRFTAQQVRNTDEATRGGLALWATTSHGRTLIARLNTAEYEIRVSEDWSELGAGRAPEPSLATLVAASDRAQTKVYHLVLNPNFVLPRGMKPLPNQPASPDEMMAAAWAGEMLHVDFYARGISLPHHYREDFQVEWRVMATELGFPALSHGGEEDAHGRTPGTDLLGTPRRAFRRQPV